MRVVIGPKGVVSTPGVDFAGRVTLVGITKRPWVMVVKIASGRYYSGLGRPWLYAPSRFRLMEITSHDPEDNSYEVYDHEMIEFTTRGERI